MHVKTRPLSSRKMSSCLNVQNIFDEVIYDSGYRSGSPFVYIAPGRIGYATLNFKY